MGMTFEQGRKEVSRLCQYFETNRNEFRASGVKEAHVRQSLIDPFFEALGWDVHNRAAVAPQYREVVPEDSLDVEGHQKAPDYTFRVGTQPKFFTEAKKCGINIGTDTGPAYQLRRYGWSAKVSLSILTDFDEFAVYDCGFWPKPTDKASQARILYLNYQEYGDNWRKLWDVFARDSVWSGAFDEYAASKRKRGTSEVDIEFLKDIEKWREELAHNVALRNSDISTEDLNAAVQRTIDRIVFLRMAEDRGLEPYQQLLKLCELDDVYRHFMIDLCRKADDKYNSGLFHFRKEPGTAESPDGITPDLTVDDRVFRSMLQSLYFEHGSPYHFGVMPVEILGTVYERFLGKVIRLTPGHQARVEEKPEVRKAGGVYYTPAEIVEYVVQHTVGSRIGGKSPSQLAGLRGSVPFRVIDIACGSGSFLLGAYSFLLNHALRWYLDHKPEASPKAVYRTSRGEWRLTIPEKKRLLTKHIFGVDIDAQAVEVTKLSLLLKALQGENETTFSDQQLLFHERALPNLSENIKCGNSLVGPEYFSGDLIPDPEEVKKINAFSWEQAFPEAALAGGFDCVIGNPPWGQKEIAESEGIKTYIRKRFPSANGIFDLFRPFVERAIRLTRPNGLWGMVLPDIVLLKDYPETRLFILDNVSLTRLDWWGMAFKDAVIDAATVIGRHGVSDNKEMVHVTVRDKAAPLEHDVDQRDFRHNPRYTFNLHRTEKVAAILEGLQDRPRLGEFFEIHEGIHSGNIREELFVPTKVDQSCRELLFGRDEIRPYFVTWKGKYVRLNAVPAVKSPKRYANIGRVEWYEQDKILVRRTGDHIMAAVDRSGRFASNNFFVVVPKSSESPPLDAIAAILNSNFMTWFFRAIEPRKGRAFAEVKIKHLRDFPIPDYATNGDQYDRLAELGKRRALLVKELERNKSTTDTPFERQASFVEGQIERSVLRALGVPDHYDGNARESGRKGSENAQQK